MVRDKFFLPQSPIPIGIGDWGLGVQTTKWYGINFIYPNPQSPIPNPQSTSGFGIGDWGLGVQTTKWYGIGFTDPNPQSPIPNPQSPIPDHRSPIPKMLTQTSGINPCDSCSGYVQPTPIPNHQSSILNPQYPPTHPPPHPQPGCRPPFVKQTLGTNPCDCSSTGTDNAGILSNVRQVDEKLFQIGLQL